MTDELRKAVQTALILTEETAKEFADYQNGNNNKSDYGGYGLQYYVDIDNAIKKLTYCDTIPIGIISDVEKIYQTWSNLLPHERRCEFQRYMEVRERETMKFHQIMGFCIDLHRVLEELHNTIERSKTTAATTQQSQPFKPDARLTTDKARAMFDAFEKAGFITKLEDGHLKWAKNKFSLKCFVDNAIKYLHLDKTKSPSGKVKKSWAIFEKLFVSDKFTTNRLQNYRINYVLSYDDNPESKEVQLIFNKNKTF